MVEKKLTEHTAFIQNILENRDSPFAAMGMYADWLEEKGEVDLAHAYRWAVYWKCFPSWNRNRTAWLRKPAKSHEKDHWELPVPIFNLLRKSSPKNDIKFYKSLELAFHALAKALKDLKDLCEVRI